LSEISVLSNSTSGICGSAKTLLKAEADPLKHSYNQWFVSPGPKKETTRNTFSVASHQIAL
jgi:hypothetical protein